MTATQKRQSVKKSRVLTERTCSKCHETKPVAKFPVRKDTKLGVAGVCCACKNRAARETYSPKYREETTAKKRARRKYHREYMRKNVLGTPKHTAYLLARRTNHWLTVAISRTKSRAKKLKIPYNLDDAWFEQHKFVTCCALTGINLRPGAPTVHGAPNPLVPSLDRIDPTKGYVKGNVRVVCHWANMAKSTMTDSEFALMVSVASSALRN